MIPRSPWAAPRRGAAPPTVTSSLASTMARSASIIVRFPASGGGSAGFSGRRLLHEAQSILDLLFLLVHLEESEMLLDGGADALLEGVALDPQVLDHPFDLARLARRLV